MNISLTPELESAVKQKVESGLYNNASEVIREALRMTLKQEQENDWLKREAAIGFAQLEAGEVTRVSSKDAFKSLVRGQNRNSKANIVEDGEADVVHTLVVDDEGFTPFVRRGQQSISIASFRATRVGLTQRQRKL